MKRKWILSPFLLLSVIGLSNAQFTATVLNNNDSSTTQLPNDPPITGRLKQFKGFHTPRPFPPNANFMYASVWASWSAWSFCAGKVQVRVRACNTVRGYSCQGPNKETKPCDIPPPHQDTTSPPREAGDYDVHDSFEADRREAMKQLYSDYDPPHEAKSKAANQDFKRQFSAGKTPTRGLKGPPPESIGREPKVQIGFAPSMTPELLYEREHVAGSDRKPVTFASKNTNGIKNAVDSNISPNTTSKSAKLAEKSSKSKHQNGLVYAGTTDEWKKNPLKIAALHPTPTTNRFSISSVAVSTTKAPSQTGRGDHVEITSSVQQYFKNTTFEGVSSSITELKQHDSNQPQPEIRAHIQEESLAAALDTSQSNTSDSIQATLKPETSTIITPPPGSRPVVARKPTVEEIEHIVRRMEKSRLNGETTSRVKENLHFGEVVHKKLIEMNNETAKALKWMLRNMSEAVQPPIAKPIPVNLRNLSNRVLNSSQSSGFRRAFASKILPGTRLSNDEFDLRKVSPSPDEEENQLQSKLFELRENMKQMETELNKLREFESRPPRFSIHKVVNLNVTPIPKALKRTISSSTAEKPSELFLVDGAQHQSSAAHWSDWGPYGECFCNKKIRTRNCIYDDPARSEGCEGKSYESIRCSGGRRPLVERLRSSCPSQRRSLGISRRDRGKTSIAVGSTARFHSISTTEQPPHGNLFYPNPLPMPQRTFSK